MDEQTPRFAVQVCSLQEEAFVEREGDRSFSALVFRTLSGWSAKGVLCLSFDTQVKTVSGLGARSSSVAQRLPSKAPNWIASTASHSSMQPVACVCLRAISMCPMCGVSQQVCLQPWKALCETATYTCAHVSTPCSENRAQKEQPQKVCVCEGIISEDTVLD